MFKNAFTYRAWSLPFFLSSSDIVEKSLEIKIKLKRFQEAFLKGFGFLRHKRRRIQFRNLILNNIYLP